MMLQNASLLLTHALGQGVEKDAPSLRSKAQQRCIHCSNTEDVAGSVCHRDEEEREGEECWAVSWKGEAQS